MLTLVIKRVPNLTPVCVCVCFQDWEFPHFMGDLDLNLPGMSTAHVKVKLPLCKSIFKEEYHIHITGGSAWAHQPPTTLA